jgi:hypothetical protein
VQAGLPRRSLRSKPHAAGSEQQHDRLRPLGARGFEHRAERRAMAFADAPGKVSLVLRHDEHRCAVQACAREVRACTGRRKSRDTVRVGKRRNAIGGRDATHRAGGIVHCGRRSSRHRYGIMP